MIVKSYRPDGLPVLEAQCDTCPTREPLIGSEHWLIPADPEMRMYCPPCTTQTAQILITAGLELH